LENDLNRQVNNSNAYPVTGQYNAHKSYNVDNGDRFQVPICTYLV